MKENQNENKVKKFWNEHKEKIVGGIIVGGCLGVGYVVGKNIIKKPKSTPVPQPWFKQLCEDIDMIKGDSTSYVPINTEEFKQMNYGNNLIRCGEGTEWLDVKGLIAFGDQVDIVEI